MTRVNFNWSRGSTPMGSVVLDRLWWRLAALNDRWAAWEPILGTSEWNLELLCQRLSNNTSALAEIHAAPRAPIQLAVTLPVIHACSRLLQAYEDAIAAQLDLKTRSLKAGAQGETAPVKKFEDAVVGLNLTGMDCIASKGVDHLNSFLRSDDSSISGLQLLSRPTSLDAIVQDGKMNLQMKTSGCPIKSLKIRAGLTEQWETMQGSFLIQVLVPRPPQLLVLISSPMILVNRTLLDLEVKLLNVANLQMEASEWPPFCIPSQYLDTQTSAIQTSVTWKSWKAEASEFVRSHTLCLPSGFHLALPPKALQSPEASFQLRPAPSSVGGMQFSFGAPVHPMAVLDSDGYVAYSRSICPEVAMPAYGLRLMEERSENLRQISIQAPFSLCNACPVDLAYHLCWSNVGWAPRILREHRDSCDAGGMLHINDGYGGIWDVPPNGFAYVAPLRLNQGGFQWWLGQRKEHQDCPTKTTVVKVKREGRKVAWYFCEAGRGISKQHPMKLAPGDAVPIYELPEQFGAAPSGGVLRQALHRNEESLPPLLMSVSLCGKSTSPWSPAIPVLVEGEMSSVPIDLGPGLTLQCDRHGGRSGECKATIYANCWFNNATGLDVLLVRGREPAPVYNDLSVMDDEAWANVDEEDESNAFHVVLLGTQRRIRLPFVGVGQSAKFPLSTTHDCILKSDFISSSSSHGVSSTLFSLIPALLAFNTLDDMEIAFCQDGQRHGSLACTWLEPKTGCSAIYWSVEGSRKLQLTLKPVTPQSPSRSTPGRSLGQWSAAFEVSEHGIGCFPIRLMDASSKDHLLCVQIQQCSSQLLTLTVGGQDACHQLLNRHPCLVVDGCFADESFEGSSHFFAVHGAKVPFGFSGVRRFNQKRSVKLLLGDTASTKSMSIELPIDRPVNRILDFEFPISLRLDIIQHVAHINISPVGLLVGGLGENTSLSWTLEANIRIPALNIGLRGGQTELAETFGCQLRGLNLQWKQADGFRETTCELGGLQVDHVHRQTKSSKRSKDSKNANRSVILASLQGQPWRLKIVREQLNESDVILRSMSLEFFPNKENEGEEGKWKGTLFAFMK